MALKKPISDRALRRRLARFNGGSRRVSLAEVDHVKKIATNKSALDRAVRDYARGYDALASDAIAIEPDFFLSAGRQYKDPREALRRPVNVEAPSHMPRSV